MVPLDASELGRISQLLERYERKSAVTRLSGLLTVPSLQANSVRIEVLVHLAVAHCHGMRKPRASIIQKWLNKELVNTSAAYLEDPVEDVFISNIETAEGNRRIFEGIWEANDYFSQVVLDTLSGTNAPDECQEIRVPALALLRLSDCVADRLGLQRWHRETSTPKGSVRIGRAAHLHTHARAVTFADEDIESLGLTREILSPFILTEEDKETLASESIGYSTLEKRPLIEFGRDIVLTLPSAVSPALRQFVLTELRKLGYLRAFGSALGSIQAQQIEKDGLWELKHEAESLEPPAPDDHVPSLHGWLLKYDVDKYLNVVLLHDRVERVEEDGLSSIMEYPETYRAGLEAYLIKIANYCGTQSSFAEGMTLVVMGGLGRGFALDFQNWPAQWRLSFIRISDLLMLAGEIDGPITRYLKCIKQKEWAEREGIYFHNINGDYNIYCFWRQLNYQLIPRELPVGESSVLSIGNDMVLPVREEVRDLMDHHTIQTTDGSYCRTMRFGRDAYFKSMQRRPIYASVEHLREGVLAGAVETQRGPSWLVIKPRQGDRQIRNLLYQMWSGFLGLYDRVVFEVEAIYSESPSGPNEIRLNFEELVVPVDYLDPSEAPEAIEPVLAVSLGRRTAEIRFPKEFLIHFQQPENTGERLVIRAIAQGLIELHEGRTNGVDETVLDGIMNTVISNPGMRVIHLFHTYDPIEYLLAQRAGTPMFLCHEDFVFSKLRLSEGCTSAPAGSSIASARECNVFLNKVVHKIWTQLREKLQLLDRASVIRQALKVHEAAIQDRNHWRRTAQAIVSLYASTEDVYAVAQERESHRNNVSLSARTVLEMAVCECPAEGGHQLSRWELDDLLAKAALLVEVAMDSDAIYIELIEPTIGLCPNGEYVINREFYQTVIRPFLTAYQREEFEGAVADYNKLYRSERPGVRKRAEEIFRDDFICAFSTEFGLTPDEAVDALAELLELAVEHDNVVVETTLGGIRTRLISNRGLSPDATESFIRTFGMFHRPAWDEHPDGFTMKDIYPWRFRRKLSSTVKPIFCFGTGNDDKALFGAGALGLGFSYLLERSERGHLPQDFFKTSTMKRYIGAISSERGREFTRDVAEQMRNNGWEVRSEVQMTEMGAPAEFGDVDVLAWKSTGEIQIIECKRLQLARTVAEIAEVCRRFRGEAKDEMDKHVQRVRWINNHPERLITVVGFAPARANIADRLVTNTHVPMMYLDALPIDANKIGPLR